VLTAIDSRYDSMKVFISGGYNLNNIQEHEVADNFISYGVSYDKIKVTCDTVTVCKDNSVYIFVRRRA
jgi:hypothetical protein